MAAPKTFPWWPAVILAAVVLAAAAAWLRLPSPPVNATAIQPPVAMEVNLANSGPAAAAGATLLEERLKIYDPTPLFLPTPRGESGDGLPAGLRPGTAVLAQEIAPTLRFSLEGLDAADGRIKMAFTTGVPVPADATAGLRLTERPDAPIALGRADPAVAALPLRLAEVVAVEANTGLVVWSLVLSETHDANAPKGNWQPLELVGSVSPMGVAGGLMVNRSSGSPTVDEYFRDQLVNRAKVGERLPPGIYVFRVGP